MQERELLLISPTLLPKRPYWFAEPQQHAHLFAYISVWMIVNIVYTNFKLTSASSYLPNYLFS